MRLVLARHGQTRANVERILDTRPPGQPLTELGRKQAEQLAAELVDDSAAGELVAVYASRALRAQQTATVVARRADDVVQLLPGVHEVQLGDLEGRCEQAAHDEFQGIYRSWHLGELDRRVPGGETGREVLARYLADVAVLRATHPTGTVLLVTHGAAMRLAGAELAFNVGGEFAEAHLMPNGRTITLDATGANWRCLQWDDVRCDH